jgi:hypothetical protein
MSFEPKTFEEWWVGMGYSSFTRGREVHRNCWDCAWLAGFKSRDQHVEKVERELAELRAEIAGGAHDSANYPEIKSKRADISEGKEPSSGPEYTRSLTFVERRCEDCGASVRYTERGCVVIGRDPQPPSEEPSRG